MSKAKVDAAITELKSLNFVGDGYYKTTVLNGREWGSFLFSDDSAPELNREVKAGSARLCVCHGTGGNFMVKLSTAGNARRIETTLFFDTLLAAVDAAESYEWVTRDHAGLVWYQTSTPGADYENWQAMLGVGDFAEISCRVDEERWFMKRVISPRAGESYEISANRWDNGEDNKHAVKTFAEAAAIAITLPSFLSVLGARS